MSNVTIPATPPNAPTMNHFNMKLPQVWVLMTWHSGLDYTGWKLVSVHATQDGAMAAAKPMVDRNEHFLIDGPAVVEV